MVNIVVVEDTVLKAQSSKQRKLRKLAVVATVKLRRIKKNTARSAVATVKV